MMKFCKQKVKLQEYVMKPKKNKKNLKNCTRNWLSVNQSKIS